VNRWILVFLILLSVPPIASAEQAGESIVALYRKGLAAQNEEAYYTAIEAYRGCLERNPVYMEPIVGLAQCYFALEEYDEALIYAKKARSLNMNDIPLMILQGRIHIGLREYENASALFTAVSSRQPNNTDAELGVAELALAQGKIEVAKSRFLEALRMNPENRRALLSLVMLYDSQRDFRKAEEYARLAVSLYPGEPEVRIVAAEHYLAMGKYADAEGHVSFALSVKPEYPKGLRMYGSILLDTGRYQEGAETLERLLRANRDQPRVWHDLANAYLILGRPNDGLNAFRTSLQLKQDEEITRYAYEYALIDLTEMKSPLRQAAAQYHFTRAAGFKERNLSEKALNEYRRGLMIDPYSKNGRLGYAQIFLERGLTGKYVAELQILTENNQGDRNINDSLEIHTSLLEASVSRSWGIDQYTLEKSSYSFSLFANPSASNLECFRAEEVLCRVLADLFRRYENLSLVNEQKITASYAEAFKIARTEGSDYFTIFTFAEGERFFTVKAKTYLSATGVELSTVTVQRTGNDRIQEALSRCVSNIHAVLPVFGRILERRFDKAVVDIGSDDGISTGNVLGIIKNRELELQKDRFGYTYDKEDLIGDFTVSRLDELVSEGTLASNSFFDMINPGDYVIFKLPEPPAEPPPQEERRNLLQRIFGLK